MSITWPANSCMLDVVGGQRTDYVKGPMGTLARIDQSNTRTYLHNDHLGSTSKATDAAGNVTFSEIYTPYGEALLKPAANDNQGGFTGHIRDKSTGLNYMQARYQDPVSGRFLSVDPVTFMETGNPAFFNRYAYAFNDPVNLTDPTGRSPLRDHYRATGNGQLPQGMKTAGSLVTGSVKGDLMVTAGAAIVLFDIATIPSGEGAVGTAMISTAMKDAAIGAATNMAIDVGVQLGENGGNLSAIDPNQTLTSGAEGALAGIPGGAAWTSREQTWQNGHQC